MDKVTALRAFTRVVEAGSFAKAATSMSMPRSSLSKAVQELETRLGIKLIERTTRSVKVSAEGLAYYDRAIRLLAELDDMDSNVVKNSVVPKGRLRVNVGAYLANHIVLPRLPEFQALYPEIELHFGVTERDADLVEEGIDCVIRGGGLPDLSLVARKLCEAAWVTCASPIHLARSGHPASPVEIEQTHAVVQYFWPRRYQPSPLVFSRGNEHHEFVGRLGLAVTDATAHVHAIKAGMGIGQTLAFLAEQHLEAGSLVEILPEWRRPPHPIFLIRPASRFTALKFRVFADWLATVFAPYDVNAPKPRSLSTPVDCHSIS